MSQCACVDTHGINYSTPPPSEEASNKDRLKNNNNENKEEIKVTKTIA